MVGVSCHLNLSRFVFTHKPPISDGRSSQIVTTTLKEPLSGIVDVMERRVNVIVLVYEVS